MSWLNKTTTEERLQELDRLFKGDKWLKSAHRYQLQFSHLVFYYVPDIFGKNPDETEILDWFVHQRILCGKDMSTLDGTSEPDIKKVHSLCVLSKRKLTQTQFNITSRTPGGNITQKSF